MTLTSTIRTKTKIAAPSSPAMMTWNGLIVTMSRSPAALRRMPKKLQKTAPTICANPALRWAAGGFGEDGGTESGMSRRSRTRRQSLTQAAAHPAARSERIWPVQRFRAATTVEERKMNAILRKLGVLLGMALLLGACQNRGMMPMQQKSLYDRLGGKDAIVAVIDDFVGNVAADNRINRYFAKTDIPRLKRNLVDQICAATGGPCTYTGRDMKTAHAGMGVTNADFDALVGDLVKSLDKFKVPDKEKGELLGILGPLRPSIVGQ